MNNPERDDWYDLMHDYDDPEDHIRTWPGVMLAVAVVAACVLLLWLV